MIPLVIRGGFMKRFVEGADRDQTTLFPECLEDWVDENNPVRVIDVFVDNLDLADLGFAGVDPQSTGRPSYHPAVLLKLYVYGYLNAVQSSRRLERDPTPSWPRHAMLTHQKCPGGVQHAKTPLSCRKSAPAALMGTTEAFSHGQDP